MSQETDERFSVEELKKMCGGFFSDNVLKNFYGAATGISWNRTCPYCQLEETRFNNHLFYAGKTTSCRECSVERITKINEDKKLKRQALKKQRGRPKKNFTSSVGTSSSP